MCVSYIYDIRMNITYKNAYMKRKYSYKYWNNKRGLISNQKISIKNRRFFNILSKIFFTKLSKYFEFDTVILIELLLLWLAQVSDVVPGPLVFWNCLSVELSFYLLEISKIDFIYIYYINCLCHNSVKCNAFVKRRQ